HQRRLHRHPEAARGHHQHGPQEPAPAKAGGRCMDNIFVERMWRSLKYEEVYLNAYATVAEARTGIGTWLSFYNEEGQYQSLGYRTPRFRCRRGRVPSANKAPGDGRPPQERRTRPRHRRGWWRNRPDRVPATGIG